MESTRQFGALRDTTGDSATAAKKRPASLMPRYPVRANGKERYRRLVDATEMLLRESGPESLTIHAIADRAGVPVSSVYHFFPQTTAACIAVAERYLDEFAAAISEPIDVPENAGWHWFVGAMIDRAMGFYAERPYARKLVLGSDYSWQVRQADLRNNRVLANVTYERLTGQLGVTPSPALTRAILVSISIAESIWSLSVAESGEITPEFAEESRLACRSYLANYIKTAEAHG